VLDDRAVAPGSVPSGWRDVPVHRIGRDEVLDRDTLRRTVDALRDAWLARRPSIVLLDAGLPWDRLLRPERETRPLWVLGPGHRLLHDELALLLGANRLDARGPDGRTAPRWWPARRALRLGCRPAPDGCDADVLLPDGRHAWIDDGPRGPIAGWPSEAARVHRESIERCGTLDEERDAAPREVLSAEQLAAVAHRHGPARVLAPAGSGKTRVLAARLRHLVHDRGVQPELITALAYNTRAAQELAERTRDVVVAGRRPRISTVHALGLAVCTAAAAHRPSVLDAAGVGRALARAAAVAGTGPTHHPDALVSALTEVRLALRDPAAVEAARGDVPGFARLVPAYRRLLHEHGQLDFDEQVHLAIGLLLADPVLRARVGRGTTHLLVDEAQDLTPAFVLLVRVLAGPQQQLFAVGDDDQTIYGYAGATPRVLVDLPDTYRGTTSYTLNVNHRCPAAVVRAAADLLAHNTLRVPKDVRASAPASPDGMTEVPADDGRGAAVVLERLRPLLDEHRPGQVAVLARVGATLLAPQLVLEDASVPVRRHVGTELLERAGIRTALAYLRCATDPDHLRPSDLADTLRRPARRLTGVLRAAPHGTSLHRLALQLTSIDAEHRDALRRYVDDLALLAALVRDGADSATVLRTVRDRIGLGASLDALDGTRLRPEGSSHGDDLDALLEVAVLEPDPRGLPDRLEARLAGRPVAPRSDAHQGAGRHDAVTLSTVHRVKGREWDVVVLVGLRAGLMPHRLCDDLEEERRVLHVALTRARRHLVLVTDRSRPSPFLAELRGSIRPAHAPAAADEAELLAALRGWRRERASHDRVPAFLVAHDRTLVDLARRRPRDRAGLRACHGIGAAKAARYGDELLRLLAEPPAP
jgi:DNA helicase II / ATP-dependent DNA helicase PcrA